MISSILLQNYKNFPEYQTKVLTLHPKNKSMLLPTMSTDEKAFEAFRIKNFAHEWARQLHDENEDKVRRAVKFPYKFSVTKKDDYGNTWIVKMVYANKTQWKQRIAHYWCYTTYRITKRDKTGNPHYDTNTGPGIIAFDPTVTKNEKFLVVDIVPHCINQYRKRHLEPLGRQDITLDAVIDSIMLRWKHFDVAEEHAMEKHDDKGLLPYNIIMQGGGQLLGNLSTPVTLILFTYVSPDMMFEDQLERQQCMMTEWSSWQANGIYTEKMKEK